jgi:hypothetical protein
MIRHHPVFWLAATIGAAALLTLFLNCAHAGVVRNGPEARHHGATKHVHPHDLFNDPLGFRRLRYRPVRAGATIDSPSLGKLRPGWYGADIAVPGAALSSLPVQRESRHHLPPPGRLAQRAIEQRKEVHRLQIRESTRSFRKIGRGTVSADLNGKRHQVRWTPFSVRLGSTLPPSDRPQQAVGGMKAGEVPLSFVIRKCFEDWESFVRWKKEQGQ